MTHNKYCITYQIDYMHSDSFHNSHARILQQIIFHSIDHSISDALWKINSHYEVTVVWLKVKKVGGYDIYKTFSFLFNIKFYWKLH